jgi:hypothetical protein
MATLSRSTIITFFGSIHLYKHGDEAQQQFLEDLVLTSTKDTRFSKNTCKNIWQQRLILH